MARNPTRLQRGSMTGRLSRRVIPFMLNPEQFSGENGWEWGKHSVPGRSHPVYGGGSGSAEVLRFTLRLDGDLGRKEALPRFAVAEDPHLFNDAVPRVARDIMPELNVLRSCARGHDASLDGAYGVPESFFMSMGTIFRGEVLIMSVGWNVTHFLPDLTAFRADVDLVCEVVSHFNQTNWLSLSLDASNAITDDPVLFGKEEDG